MISVANTANTNTWEFLINRVNEVANHMTKAVVTSDGSGNNNVTNGNVIITGSFTANTVSVGNTTANLVIRTPNTQVVSNGQFYLNANGSWTIPDIFSNIFKNRINTSGTSAQTIDSFPLSLYSSAEYLLYVKDNVANNRQTTKLLVMHDGSFSQHVEYGTIVSNSSVGVFNATQNSSHVVLQFTPVSSNTTIDYFKTVI